MRTLASRFAGALAAAALAAGYFSHVFRLPDNAALTTGLGDWVDPYFINFLLEHWHKSVWSLSDPSSPPMYFPVRGTLGYSHGLILYAPFYIAARLFLDPFQAHNATLFLVLVTGSVCLYVVLRRSVALRVVESLLLTAFFFTSANVVNGGTGVWSQRGSVFLIPPMIGLALATVRASDGRMRRGLAWIAGLLLSLLFTQDFYTGLLALLVLALVLAPAPLVTGKALGRTAADVWHAVALVERADPTRLPHRPSRWWLIAAVVGLVWALAVLIHPVEPTTIGSVRFSATDPTRPILIVLLAGGWYIFRHARRIDRVLLENRRDRESWAPIVGEIATVWQARRPDVLALLGGGLIGGLLFLWVYLGAYREHPAFPDEHLMNSLRPSGPYDSVRPFVLVLAVCILAWLPWLRVNRRLRLSCLWLLVVSAIVYVIPLRFGQFSVWKTVFAPLPGFSVIRDPGRIIPLYELAVVLSMGLLLSRLPATSFFRASVLALVFLLLVTDRNREVFDFGRPRSVYARWVAAPIDIDPRCQSFFIKGASPEYMSRSFHMWALYGVDAMFIALDRSMPTLNGYSAWSPTGWGLANPQEPGYAEAVDRWIDQHHLRGVCELDIERRTMTPYRR